MRSRQTGAALLIMLWAIGLLSAAVIALAVYLQSGLDEDVANSKLFRARQLAESGVAVAMHPVVKRFDPLLRRELSSGQGYEVTVRSEGARLNPNGIAAREDDDLFLDLFARWGLSLEEAQQLTDSILDWIDGDDLKRLQGAEKADYTKWDKPQYPRDRPLESIDEMAEIAGMDMLAKVKPDWREYFTVWSQGKIDVNSANAEILEIATGSRPEAVESLLRTRMGIDGVPDTEDDYTFQDLGEVRTALGMSEAEFDVIADRLSVSDALQRIESVGWLGDFRKRVSVVVRKEDARSSILTWLEQ